MLTGSFNSCGTSQVHLPFSNIPEKNSLNVISIFVIKKPVKFKVDVRCTTSPKSLEYTERSICHATITRPRHPDRGMREESRHALFTSNQPFTRKASESRNSKSQTDRDILFTGLYLRDGRNHRYFLLGNSANGLTERQAVGKMDPFEVRMQFLNQLKRLTAYGWFGLLNVLMLF